MHCHDNNAGPLWLLCVSGLESEGALLGVPLYTNISLCSLLSLSLCMCVCAGPSATDMVGSTNVVHHISKYCSCKCCLCVCLHGIVLYS